MNSNLEHDLKSIDLLLWGQLLIIKIVMLVKNLSYHIFDCMDLKMK